MYQQGPYDAHVSPRAQQNGNANAAMSGYPAAAAEAVPVASAAQQPQQPQPPFVVAHPLPSNMVLPPGAHLPQPLAPVPVQQVMLPPGAQLYNGGVLYAANVFANSYSVPGPNGVGLVHYDNSMPMPPQPREPPSLKEQWHSMTKLIKLFIVLLGLFWLFHWLVSWTVALFMPILFIPTYILWRKWRSHHESVELLMIAKLYTTAFVPGALVVMLVESVITVVFLVVCFRGYIAQMMNTAQTGGGSNADPSDPSKPDDGGGDSSGMEFLNFPISPALIIFLLLLSYVTAGGTEESLKYYLTNSVKKHRPSYKVVYGYLLYAVASALGFSTMENIGYVLTGALNKGGDDSALGVFLNTCGRAFISTPLHVMTGYLIGLQVVRRDVFGESLPLWRVMGWSVFFHGTFDFGLFVIMVLQKQLWSGDGGDGSGSDSWIPLVLMGCVVANCFAGLSYKIWRGRQMVFNRVEFPGGHEGAGPEVAEQHAEMDGHHHGAAPAAGAGSIQGDGAVAAGASRNGFSRLQEVDSAV